MCAFSFYYYYIIDLQRSAVCNPLPTNLTLGKVFLFPPFPKTLHEILVHISTGVIHLKISQSDLLLVRNNGPPIRKCAGVNTSKSNGLLLSGVIGLEFIHASTWHNRVFSSPKVRRVSFIIRVK